jgi:histidine triad (HIT) family protein
MSRAGSVNVSFRLAPYDSCSFCRYLAGEAECVFVAREERVAAFVNRTQYERGAMLVVPNAHRETILEIQDEEIASIYKLAKRLARATQNAFGAVGVNVFQNNGIKAGQHVPHYHVHVVPRYENSDSEKIFLQRNFEIASRAEQQNVADAIRAALIAG